MSELCREIRDKEEFCSNESLKKMVFNADYVRRVMRDQELIFATWKSHQEPISETRLNELRASMNMTLQNYKPSHVLNCDESGYAFKEQGGRIILKG